MTKKDALPRVDEQTVIRPERATAPTNEQAVHGALDLSRPSLGADALSGRRGVEAATVARARLGCEVATLVALGR